MKDLHQSVGYITYISEPETVNRPGKPPVDKVCITFEREDGQVGFFEARKKVIDKMEALDIREQSKVKIGFVFIGSVKGDKKFNNFFINEIEHA